MSVNVDMMISMNVDRSLSLNSGSSGSSVVSDNEEVIPTRGIDVQWIGANVGRGVVSARDFAAGDVVFEEEPLAAAVVDPSRCDYTFSQGATVRSSMTKLRFSSKSALHSAWKQYFKKESKALTSIQQEITPAMKAAMRICWRGEIGIVGELETHWDSWSDARREEFVSRGKIVSEAAGRGGAQNATPEACARLLAALAVNATSVTDEVTQKEVAIALYRRAARLNHDSDPNAVQTFRGRTLVLRALRPIGSGEEIRVTYLDLALSAPEQRRRLQEQYHFDYFPEMGAPSRHFLPSGIMRVAAGAQALPEPQLRLMAVLDGSRSLKGGCDLIGGDEVWAVDGGEGHWERAAKSVRAVREELASAVKARDLRSLRAIALGERDNSKCIRVGKTHAVRVEAARELLDAAVDAHQWELACSAAEALAEMYRKIYPQFSVATGVAEAKAAKLFWLLENGAAARRHAKRALAHLEKLVPCSALIAEVQEVLAQVDCVAAAPAPASLAVAAVPVQAAVA
jgi:hypothetical protein